jgi:gamma-glutamylaminecyclotransferase
MVVSPLSLEADVPATKRLFVYGTLKRDGCRHGPLAGQRFLGEVRTRPCYALLDLGAYPGLVLCTNDGQAVTGELYEIDVALLPWLDGVEGAPDLYRLGPVELEGATEQAHAYFYQRPALAAPLCPEGRWDNAARGTARGGAGE